MPMSADLARPGLDNLDGLAVDLDRAGHADQRAEQGEQQLALALTVEAAETDDLAGPDFEIDAVELPGPGEVVERAAPVRRRASAPQRREHALVFAADHHLDDGVVALGSGVERRDVATVAEDRALVGKLGDLVHAMRNIDDREAIGPELLQHPEDLGHVRRGQRRGRLVEDQDLGIARQRLGDFHHLPPRQRQVAYRRQRMNVLGANPGQRLLGEPPLCGLVDQSEALGRMGDGDVVGDREVRQQRQFLEDAGDAGVVRRRRGGERYRLSIEDDAARIGLHDAGENLDQRRLAGTVLAEKRMDFAAVALETEHPQARVRRRSVWICLHAQQWRRAASHRFPPPPKKKGAAGNDYHPRRPLS